MDTGFTDWVLSGVAPTLPEPLDHDEVAAEIVAALRRRSTRARLGPRGPSARGALRRSRRAHCG
jgi:hypothetical protein